MTTRTCVGCRETADPEELLRLVHGPEGEVVPDLAGGAFGRGAWVHPRPECLSRAVPKGLERALKAKGVADVAAVSSLVRASAARRLLGLLSSARRARKAAAGTTAVKEALDRGEVRLVLVATDARAAANAPWIEEKIRLGTALPFSTKAELGSLLGLEEVGVVAVLDDGLARAIERAWALAHLPESRVTRAKEKLSTEVR
jgi:predicted RNA-binding protein YlxR (DUF448 family)